MNGRTGHGSGHRDERYAPGSVVGEIQKEFRIEMLEMGLYHCVVLTRPERVSEETKISVGIR